MDIAKLLGGLLDSAGQASRQHDIRWGQVGAGAAAGGALGLLLGSRKGKGFSSKALKYGSVAAIGYAAYKLYEKHQASKAVAPTASAPAWPAPGQPALPAPQQEWHSQLMLRAMMAAAKADGHVDERERGLIEAELQRQEADAQERAWLEAELRKPLDPAEVARGIAGQPAAAEVYLASLLVADETNFMERAYLDELARQLQLPEGLKRDLEAQAASAG
ncbi:tellurite resistance TerB family protein [Inhella sp.]|uniref:tellurite resistance TerB family protein n=1 Tax=Inhella sp. TaxID=1921806 RepID=UPI0035B13AD6